MHAARFILLCLLLTGCATETRVVRYHPMLGGLPGSESQTPDQRGDLGFVDPTAIPADQLVKEDPVTKKKTLTTKSGRHLMVHIYNAIKDNDKETFVTQILSKETRDECSSRGVDPGSCFDEVVRRRDDVTALFNAMPSGEYTPGAMMVPLGPKTERVMLQGLAAQDLPWTGFDMIQEKGNWKLRWFYGPHE